MFGPELFLAGPSAVDRALCASEHSAEGLLPIASNAVDILLCYRQGKARLSYGAAQVVSAALEIYADSLPTAGELHEALAVLRQRLLGDPVAIPKKEKKNYTNEATGHTLRAIASGVPSIQPIQNLTRLQHNLCLQLHLCNFVQSVRTLSLLDFLTRQCNSKPSESSQIFHKQAKDYLSLVVRNTEAADLSWEYKLYRFTLRRT
jgi:hypothetical protein